MDKPEFIKLDPPERRRSYIFPLTDGESFNLTFENIVAIAVSKSGTHRLETADGLKHIVSTGWITIELDMDDWTL